MPTAAPYRMRGLRHRDGRRSRVAGLTTGWWTTFGMRPSSLHQSKVNLTAHPRMPGNGGLLSVEPAARQTRSEER